MDREIAIARMAASAPGVNGKSEAAGNVAGDVLAARLPLVFPAHQVGGDGQLLAVGFLARAGHVRDSCQRSSGSMLSLAARSSSAPMVMTRGLWMIGRAPGSRRADVVADGGVFLALVGNAEDVGNRRHASAARAAGSPGLRLPGRERAVFLSGRSLPGHTPKDARPRPSVPASRSSMMRTGLPPAFLESSAAVMSQRSAANLLPNPPPMWS